MASERISSEFMLSRLEQKHAAIKAQLAALNARRYLPPDEEVERRRLQKLKLSYKDQIAELLS